MYKEIIFIFEIDRNKLFSLVFGYYFGFLVLFVLFWGFWQLSVLFWFVFSNTKAYNLYFFWFSL